MLMRLGCAYSGQQTTFEMADKAAADQQYIALSGAVISNRVISGLFGVEPPLDLDAGGIPESFLRDADSPRGFEGTLSGLRIQGRLYTVVSGPKGLTIHAE